MDISIVMPAYQEADNLRKLLPQLNMVFEGTNVAYELLVIDTISPLDDTKQVCEANGAVYITRKGGNYYGDAIRTGINEARGRYMIIMDADGSHNPSDCFRMHYEMLSGEYDLIIGSRYCNGGYTDNVFILRFMSWILNVSYRLIFKLKVKDVSNSFRMYHTEEVKQIKLECKNFDIVEEILIRLNSIYKPLRIKEIPISFNKRDEGKSKRSLVKFIFSYIKTIRRLYSIKNR